MAFQIWADVGGTFTDCILQDGNHLDSIKVLSSGVMRCHAHQIDERQYRLDDALCDAPDEFWNGATINGIRQSGESEKLGLCVGYRSANRTLLVDTSHFRSSERLVLEIDPNLQAPALASHILLRCPVNTPLPPLDVRLGTTKGTNALLTRSGVTTAILITRGFADLPLIGEQDRPELFELTIRKPEPLTRRIVEISERLDCTGNIVTPIDLDNAGQQLQRLYDQGVRSIAICLMHSFLNDQHERSLENLARRVGFKDISRSSEVAPLIKLLYRTDTTTLDAYLNPLLREYVDTVWKQLGGPNNCRLRLMTSSGNLVSPESFRGRDSILSGPAGGVVALSRVADQADCSGAIGLDMGGTSTDVSRYHGRLGRRYESIVSGVRVFTPMMDIETVAAGGGSICDFQNGRLTVGPASAGADPGPACYGRGGPLTVTDCNLILGRIDQDRFPFPLHGAAAESRLQELVACVVDEIGSELTVESLANGFLKIAVTHMAEAVRSVTTAEGIDVREMTLVGFGGAAAQHLCHVAESLGMKRVLDHPQASVLSALGMGLASIGRVVTRGIYRPLGEVDKSELHQFALELKQQASQKLREEEAIGAAQTIIEWDLRYIGTDSTLTVVSDSPQNLAADFHQRHQATFGYQRHDRQIELVVMRCEAISSPRTASSNTGATYKESLTANKTIWLDNSPVEARVVDRACLQPGDTIQGSTLVVSDQSTLLVLPCWEGRVLPDGTIDLRQCSVPETNRAVAAAHDEPVLLEVIARRLQGIADAMGEVLRRTSVSVNIKERRDYSCAIFRGDGSLVANAPHVPVHLGAMGHTVRRLIEVYPDMSPGDCYLSNDPYAGGSHLPDVTLVTPVFCNDQDTRVDFFVASRAHHAEIGGRTPGSMPPDATCLAEEGVVLRDFALIRNGIHHHDALLKELSSGEFPSRTPHENLADIAAQQAAGLEGARGLSQLVADYDLSTINDFMGQILNVASDSALRFIRSLNDTNYSFTDYLDDGSQISVNIEKRDDRLRIDFSGTRETHPLCYNATPSIVTAAVLYVIRCLSDSSMPLCDGVLGNVDLIIPTGMLNPTWNSDPEKCAAVVAGNVETSQRIVDVLLGAFGAVAASQGTMNNLLLGDSSFGYYETICGGSGATEHGPGVSAVHTHMTNTRITDPEVFETRVPARIQQFAIRRGSGGQGIHDGGDGVVREIEFLKPLTISLITNRRETQPYGCRGGMPGHPGQNQWITKHEVRDLGPATTIAVNQGDRLIIQTPGGGGWGATSQSDTEASPDGE